MPKTLLALAVEKYNSCEFYRRRCDVFGEASFGKKKKKWNTNVLNMDLPEGASVEKTIYGLERQWLSVKW